jgi:hypothetical protein
MANKTVVNPSSSGEYLYDKIKFIGDNEYFYGPYMGGYKDISVNGNNDNLGLARTWYDTVTVNGHNNTIGASLTTNVTIDDHSQGLTLNMGWEPSVNMTLEDFQHDKTGKIIFATFNANQTVSYSSDQHGGTMVSIVPPSATVPYAGATYAIDVKGYSDAADLAKHVVVQHLVY